ncbi:filamentous hemagglutinin N-terminal domain-containing protein [Sphingopyxis sp.]|uniref:filamentous hemagglutinin N-terminal domain-containing protein n=1 Tax=Sphingopyxis sp. TaxID=1908224 RepID=UPI003BAD934F
MATSARADILSRALGGTALSSIPKAFGPGSRLVHAALIAALVVAPVQAQQAALTIDPAQSGAGAPRMDMAPNGTPVVKIAAPSASGVSRNLYTDFNLDARGLILNNSGSIVTTQLAGYVDANGNLKASGPARIILNEVTGANRSMLGGYLEVAGAGADIVIANPYGISCNGCGFINAPGVTMVAGRATIDGTGGITGYRVDPGNGALSIGGPGLDASGARLALFARAIDVNAGVWADRIDTAYGAGEASIAGGDIVVTARGGGAAAAPAVALDVAALGGMYARSIRLVGTEAGLGVNVSGTLASLDQGISLAADGHVTIGGRVISAGVAEISTSDRLSVSGSLFADATVAITAAGVDASGLIAGTGNVSIVTGEVAGTGTIVAGLRRDGTLGESGDLALSSRGALTLSGNVVAAGSLVADAASLTRGRAKSPGPAIVRSEDRRYIGLGLILPEISAF